MTRVDTFEKPCVVKVTSTVRIGGVSWKQLPRPNQGYGQEIRMIIRLLTISFLIWQSIADVLR